MQPAKEDFGKQQACQVSFLLAYHNEPVAMLRECIESICALNLTPDEGEIILVDDGSDHSPMPHLQAFAHRVTYLRQENKGLSAARNTALQRARGRYIQFVDADDRLIPHAYDHCLGALRSLQPDLLLFRSTTLPDAAANPRPFSACTTGPQYMATRNLRPAAWGYLFRRDLAEGLTFAEGRLHEDEEFTPLLTLRAERLCKTNTCAYYYRQREGSITHNDDPQNLRRRFADYEHAIDRLREVQATATGMAHKALGRRIDQMAMASVYNGMTLLKRTDDQEAHIDHLRQRGLFPLPIKAYTPVYLAFSLMTRWRVGRRLAAILINRLPNQGKRT